MFIEFYLHDLYYRITCTNQTSSNSKSVVVATQGSTSYKDNISSVFGIKQLLSILEIKPDYVSNIKENIFKGLSGNVENTEESMPIEDVEIDLSEDSNDAENPNEIHAISQTQKSQGYKNVASPIEFAGFISSCAHGCGRSSTDRQFFYINNRPCEPTKVIKLINEIYRQYNPGQHPFVLLNINLERTCVDVNVTPDKRKVFLTKEKIILDVLKSSLLKLFESIPRTLKVETPLCSQEINHAVRPELDQPRIFNSFLQQFDKHKGNLHFKPSKNDAKLELKRKSTSMMDYISAKTIKTNSNESNIETFNEKDGTLNTELVDINKIVENEENKELNNKTNYDNNDNPTTNKDNCYSSPFKPEITHIESKIYENKEILYLDSTDNLLDTQIRNLSEVVIEKSHTIKCKPKKINSTLNKSTEFTKKSAHEDVKTDKEDIGIKYRKSITMKTSLENVKALTEIYHKHKTTTVPTEVKFRNAINPVFNKKCEEELSREISKDSFKEMQVIGQFNLGFIITKLDVDLFIIDQHATDEIYNFEMLQKTTELTSQKLVM